MILDLFERRPAKRADPSLRRRAFIHIGIHKTGSSSIQHALYGCARSLSRHGVLYPTLERNHSNLTILFRDDPARDRIAKVLGLRDSVSVAAHCSDIRSDLARLSTLEHGSLILSGEGFSLLSYSEAERVRDWLGDYDVRVMAYLREPRAWASSAAQQRVKAGKTLESVIARTDLCPRFRRRLSPWLQAFGHAGLSLFDFDRAKLHAGGITGHFAEEVGIPERLKSRISGLRVNESLSAEAVRHLSEWNRDGTGRPPKGRIAALKKLNGARFVLEPRVLDRVERQSASDLVWLKQEFEFAFSPPSQ